MIWILDEKNAHSTFAFMLSHSKTVDILVSHKKCAPSSAKDLLHAGPFRSDSAFFAENALCPSTMKVSHSTTAHVLLLERNGAPSSGKELMQRESCVHQFTMNGTSDQQLSDCHDTLSDSDSSFRQKKISCTSLSPAVSE